jgi:hypothetical protein
MEDFFFKKENKESKTQLKKRLSTLKNNDIFLYEKFDFITKNIFDIKNEGDAIDELFIDLCKKKTCQEVMFFYCYKYNVSYNKIIIDNMNISIKNKIVSDLFSKFNSLIEKQNYDLKNSLLLLFKDQIIDDFFYIIFYKELIPLIMFENLKLNELKINEIFNSEKLRKDIYAKSIIYLLSQN